MLIVRYRLLLTATALVVVGCQTNTGESPVRTFPLRPSTTTSSVLVPPRPSTTTSSVLVPPRPSTTTSSVSVPTTIIADFSFVADMFPFEDDSIEVRGCYDRGYYAQPVTCKSLHDGQAIGLGVLDSSLLLIKEKDVWLKAIDDRCLPLFETFRAFETYSRTGQSVDSSSFVLDAIVKRVNPLTIYCTVVSRDATKWLGSAEIVVGTYSDVGVGDCFNPPTQLDDAEVVPCSEPHYAEMFLKDALIGLNLELDPYPSEANWGEIMVRLCSQSFRQYTGKRIEDVDYSMALIYPVKSDWKDLNRRVASCAITSGTGQQWVGSKRK